MMLTTSDVAKVYDTILGIPGMNEMVKIDMKISRKNVLLLHSVILPLFPDRRPWHFFYQRTSPQSLTFHHYQ